MLPITVAVLLGFALGAEPPPAAGTHFIYLVRHGIYDRDDAATDDRRANGLNAKGHQQAQLAGERLAKLPVRFDRLISSELLRATETADDIGKIVHLTPTHDAVLNECSPTSSHRRAPTPDALARTAACDAARAQQWTKYFAATPARDTYDVLVCHGNVIRWTLLRALGADTQAWDALDSANGSFTIIAIEPDGSAHVVSYDDVGHIPPALQTWSGRGGGGGNVPVPVPARVPASPR